MENIGENKEPKPVVKQPNNNMVFAVIATIAGIYSFLFAGFFVGLVAIFMAKHSTNKYMSGDYEGAVRKAKSSRKLCYIVLGLVGVAVLYTGYVINQEGGLQAFIEQMKEVSKKTK